MFSHRTNWKLTPNPYTQVLEELRSSSSKLIDLTVSNPTECGLQYDSAEILRAFQNPNALKYEPEAKGLRQAREEVARYYREEHEEAVDPEALLLTSSTSEAYSYVFRLLCNPQDEILAPKPSYPLFDFLGDLLDVRLIPYQLHYAQGWFIDFESIAKAITAKTRAILLVHPNNPTGSFVSAEERQRLNALCGEHNLALIVDEVFLDYALPGNPRRKSFAGNLETLTFTLSGLSKIAALPQMKVAWMAASGPAELSQPALQRLEIIADTYLSLSSPTQWAFPRLLAQRRNLQPQLLDRLSANWAWLKNALAGNTEYELLETQGGWYAVLRILSGASDEELAIALMKRHGVVVHPGHFYDFANGEYLVASLITPSADFQSGIAALLSK